MRNNWLLGIFLLLGCTSQMPLSPQALCEGLQKTHCARLFQCATTPEAQAALKLLYVDQDDCVTQGIAMQHPTCSQWTEANVCGGFLTWNGDAGPTCLNDLNAQSCGRVITAVLPTSCTPSAYCL